MHQTAAAAASVAAFPMRVAVISDVHSNLHALQAVLADIDAATPDEIWCLGDVVGYGPRPNECADIVRERSAIVLVGNHDLASIGKLDTGDFGAARGRVRPLDGAGARRGAGGLAADARARRPRARGSISSTAARAIRSGSTC